MRKPKKDTVFADFSPVLHFGGGYDLMERFPSDMNPVSHSEGQTWIDDSYLDIWERWLRHR